MDKLISRDCKTHGTTEFILEGSGYYRCKKCRSGSVHRHRKRMKAKGIKYLGGSCSNCGYSKCMAALHFHHKDPSKKDFGLSIKGVTRSWEKYKAELDKCELLCANCHAETHAEE